jgi:hypothetical protein
MTNATGLIIWATTAVLIPVGLALTVWAAASWARRKLRDRISYERRLRAAVARHPAGRNR